jgi:hypothetical protein
MTAVSQRLMNTEATEPTSGASPLSIRRSIPRRYASAAAMYCSRENKRVTLTGIPAKIASSMAGRPSLVLVSQISRGFASVPAGEIPPGESIVK